MFLDSCKKLLGKNSKIIHEAFPTVWELRNKISNWKKRKRIFKRTMTRSFFSIGTFHMHIAIPAMAASCRSFGTAGDIGSTRPTDLAETRTVSQSGTRIGSNTVTNIQTFAPLVSIGICTPLKISTTLRYTIIIFL